MDEFPFSLEIPVAWGDMDAYGHVNNTVFFRWFESVRIEMIQQLGMSADRPDGVGPILATTTCDYLRPVEYPATVVSRGRISKVGRTSIVVEHLVTEDGEPVAKGTGVMVLLNYDTGEKVPVPDDIRAAIEALG